jgi:hypothetical protein
MIGLIGMKQQFKQKDITACLNDACGDRKQGEFHRLPKGLVGFFLTHGLPPPMDCFAIV